MFLFSTLEMRLLQLLIPLPWTPPPRISHVGILLDVLENQGHFFFFSSENKLKNKVMEPGQEEKKEKTKGKGETSLSLIWCEFGGVAGG